jgi:hypothetical protein
MYSAGGGLPGMGDLLKASKAKNCSVAGCGKPRFKGGYCAECFNNENDEKETRPAAEDKDEVEEPIVAKPASVKKAFTSGVKWWERAKEEVVHTVWQACVTADGLDYYYNTETKETTWDKPEELMTPGEIDSQGKWVWVPHGEEVYKPGKVTGEYGKSTNAQLEDGTEVSVPSKDVIPLSKSSLQRIVADLVLLDDMSPPLILHCLKQRFIKDNIYTNVGTILISVNPYRQMDLYRC